MEIGKITVNENIIMLMYVSRVRGALEASRRVPARSPCCVLDTVNFLTELNLVDIVLNKKNNKNKKERNENKKKMKKKKM